MAPNMAKPTMTRITHESHSVRMRNRRSGIAGSSTRRSTTTNATPRRWHTPRPMITGDPHSYSTPPHDVSKTSVEMPAARSALPIQSIFTSVRRRLGGSTAAVTTTATIPMGMFTKKIHRHERVSVRNPPTRGPSTLAAPNTAPKKPWYLPRSRGSTTSAMIAWATMKRPPAPKPWIARQTMSWSIVTERPASRLPPTKSPMPIWKSIFRP